MATLPERIITHSIYFAVVGKSEEVVRPTRDHFNVRKVLHKCWILSLKLSFNLNEALLEVIEQVNGGNDLVDLENINLSFLSQYKHPLSSERSLSDFRLPGNLL